MQEMAAIGSNFGANQQTTNDMPRNMKMMSKTLA
jgi:hypothetical protein